MQRATLRVILPCFFFCLPPPSKDHAAVAKLVSAWPTINWDSCRLHYYHHVRDAQLVSACNILPALLLQAESLRSLRKASDASSGTGAESPHAPGASPSELHHASLKVASWSSQNGENPLSPRR